MSAAFYAQFMLNNGKPVGASIPATEHSVMTSFLTEKAAIENMINKFGSGVFACVMDTYDYTFALEKILPAIVKQKTEKGGFMVIRPDSGEPSEVVLQALKAAEKICEVKINEHGKKVRYIPLFMFISCLFILFYFIELFFFLFFFPFFFFKGFNWICCYSRRWYLPPKNQRNFRCYY